MGVHHEYGYSAAVQGFFVTGDCKVRLAKTNSSSFVVAESCQLPPGTEGELLIIVDGNEDTRRVVLPEGIALGQTSVSYVISAPF